MTADRGWLKIDHTVVKKVAQHAADGVRGVAVEQAKGRTRGSTARIGGQGNNVDLALELALHYPAPVSSVVADVRQAVITEIERITSYRVRTVDVVVSSLVPDIAPRVR